MREIRSSGSAEGVMGNCDPYSDSPEPAVVKQPQFTRVKEPTLLWCSNASEARYAPLLHPTNQVRTGTHSVPFVDFIGTHDLRLPHHGGTDTHSGKTVLPCQINIR